MNIDLKQLEINVNFHSLQPGFLNSELHYVIASDEDIDTMKKSLQEKYGEVETHIVSSREAQHQLFVVNDVEISVSDNMVYFRMKAPFYESHYQHAKE